MRWADRAIASSTMCASLRTEASRFRPSRIGATGGRREARSTPSGSVGSIDLDDLINVNSIDYIFVVN